MALLFRPGFFCNHVHVQFGNLGKCFSSLWSFCFFLLRVLHVQSTIDIAALKNEREGKRKGKRKGKKNNRSPEYFINLSKALQRIICIAITRHIGNAHYIVIAYNYERRGTRPSLTSPASVFQRTYSNTPISPTWSITITGWDGVKPRLRRHWPRHPACPSPEVHLDNGFINIIVSTQWTEGLTSFIGVGTSTITYSWDSKFEYHLYQPNINTSTQSI